MRGSPAGTAESDASEPPPLSRNRDFLLLWTSQAVSVLGSQVSGIAYPLLVLALTDSATKAGIVASTFLLPTLLFHLHAGALIDRWNRKHVMLACEAVRGVGAASIVVALAVDRLTFEQILLVAFVEGSLWIFFGLAELAALPRVVTPARVSEAIARNESRTYAATLIGPPLGGALFALGRAAPFLVDAVSYVLSFLFVSLVRSELQEERAPAKRQMHHEIREGIAWLWRQPFLRYSVFLVGGINVVANSVILVAIVQAQRHDVHPSLIGAMIAAVGIGGLLGSLAAPRIQRQLHTRVVVLGTLWLDALLIFLLVPTANPIWFGAVFATIGFLGPIWNSVVTGYRVAIVPDRLQGRVNSAARLVAFGTQPLGFVIAGVAADTVGTVAAIVGFAALMLALAVAATLTPSVRNVADLKQLLAEREKEEESGPLRRRCPPVTEHPLQ
jgi:predicted MFS family arabinose efflux permease